MQAARAGDSRTKGRHYTMAIVYEKLLNLAIPTIEQTYAPKDAMLYALGVGLRLDPMDRGQLDFVFEKNLKVLPTFAVVLAHPRLWVRTSMRGSTRSSCAGEQGLILHGPLPSNGALIGRSRITGVVDKGEGRGALVMSERKISDHATGGHLATVTQTAFCRGDGELPLNRARALKSLLFPTNAPNEYG